jgi:hypothetical protein
MRRRRDPPGGAFALRTRTRRPVPGRSRTRGSTRRRAGSGRRAGPVRGCRRGTSRWDRSGHGEWRTGRPGETQPRCMWESLMPGSSVRLPDRRRQRPVAPRKVLARADSGDPVAKRDHRITCRWPVHHPTAGRDHVRVVVQHGPHSRPPEAVCSFPNIRHRTICAFGRKPHRRRRFHVKKRGAWPTSRLSQPRSHNHENPRAPTSTTSPPPSAARVWPVTKLASSLARKATTAAISSGSHARCSGR